MTFGFAPLSTLPISGLPTQIVLTPVVVSGAAFPGHRVLLKRKYLYPDDEPVIEALAVKPTITSRQLEELATAILGLTPPVKAKRPYVILQAKSALNVQLKVNTALDLSFEPGLVLEGMPLIFLSHEELISITQVEAVVLSHEN